MGAVKWSLIVRMQIRLQPVLGVQQSLLEDGNGYTVVIDRQRTSFQSSEQVQDVDGCRMVRFQERVEKGACGNPL